MAATKAMKSRARTRGRLVGGALEATVRLRWGPAMQRTASPSVRVMRRVVDHRATAFGSVLTYPHLLGGFSTCKGTVDPD